MRALTSLVLASASPRRLALLGALGLDVRVVPSRVVEGDRPGETPQAVALWYARLKADAVAAREPSEFVVAADTVVDLDGLALGKPKGDDDAAGMLHRLAGREHTVHSAYAVRDAREGVSFEALSSTRVRFVPLDDATIRTYVASGDPHDKAGAYGIQGAGAALVERIHGDFYTVMGFPLGDFLRRLAAHGYAIGAAQPFAAT